MTAGTSQQTFSLGADEQLRFESAGILIRGALNSRIGKVYVTSRRIVFCSTSRALAILIMLLAIIVVGVPVSLIIHPFFGLMIGIAIGVWWFLYGAKHERLVYDLSYDGMVSASDETYGMSKTVKIVDREGRSVQIRADTPGLDAALLLMAKQG